ncbi:DUF6471 domain-containing protein [Methylorubrum salsuginis]|uniref:DUF6471 domain-containing protein n=1 Tax=Methylorubrum salsuginis TaxID=414703 RepID=A0A1I4K594_9HYPH|nr:DUF6471 domain-containing protein [Methylorubrum salsuginis]SFL73914.1 hypothetical protein SAMN04488125_1233 [Methylorubrum salsuginis]
MRRRGSIPEPPRHDRPIRSATAGPVVPEDDEQGPRKIFLKAVLKRNGVSYTQLAEKLGELSAEDSEQNIANKIGRGGFTTNFLLHCLAAIKCINVTLDFYIIIS